MIKKFFCRRDPAAPVATDKSLPKKSAIMNIGKKMLIAAVLVLAGTVLINRLPIYSIASNMWASKTSDYINLSPLLSGNYAVSTNNFKTAIKNLESALKISKISPEAKNAIYQQLFVLQIKDGNFSAANRLIKKIRPLLKNAQPQNNEFVNLVNLFISINQIKANRWDSSVLSNAKNTGLGPVGTTIVSSWGDASRNNGDAALAKLNRLASSNPRDGGILSQRDLMKLFLKKPISINDLTGTNKAVKLDNLPLAQSRIYLHSLNQQKKWGEMQKFINELNRPLPLTMLDDEEKIKSKTPLSPLVKNPEDGLSYFLLDIAANLATTNPNSGLLFCQLALFANKKNIDAQFMLANIESNLGLTDDALDTLELLKKKKNYIHLANLQENAIWQSLGKDKKARRNLKSLARRHPTIIDYQLALGEFNMSQNKYRDAQKNYQAAIDISRNYKLSRNSWFYYFQHGVALERNNQWALAEKRFLTALALNPNSPEVLNYLGYSWVERQKKIGEALAMLQKANKLSPNNGAILDSLGWAYYKLGKYDTARDYLEKAGQLIATDPEINEHLGDVYWRLKKKTTAQLFWKKSLQHLDSKTSRTNANALEKKIKSGL